MSVNIGLRLFREITAWSTTSSSKIDVAIATAEKMNERRLDIFKSCQESPRRNFRGGGTHAIQASEAYVSIDANRYDAVNAPEIVLLQKF